MDGHAAGTVASRSSPVPLPEPGVVGVVRIRDGRTAAGGGGPHAAGNHAHSIGRGYEHAAAARWAAYRCFPGGHWPVWRPTHPQTGKSGFALHALSGKPQSLLSRRGTGVRSRTFRELRSVSRGSRISRGAPLSRCPGFGSHGTSRHGGG